MPCLQKNHEPSTGVRCHSHSLGINRGESEISNQLEGWTVSQLVLFAQSCHIQQASLTVGKKYEIVATPTLTEESNLRSGLYRKQWRKKILAACVENHEHPGVDVSQDGFTSCPPSHAPMRLRLLIPIEASLCNRTFSRGEKSTRKWKSGQEEEDHERHDDCWDRLNLPSSTNETDVMNK